MYTETVGPPDTGLFRWINQWPQSLGPFMKFLSEATNYLPVKLILLLLLGAMIWKGASSRKTALLALVAVAVANTLTEGFKHGLPMHRPFQDFPNDVTMWVGKTTNFGTASAHSANMAAVAFVFTHYLKRWGIPWIAIAVLVGISRVFCGAHYPYQVSLGWACGLVAGWATVKVYDLWALRRSMPDSKTTEA